MPRPPGSMRDAALYKYRLKQLMARMGGKHPFSPSEIREQFKVIQEFGRLCGLVIPSDITVEGTEFNPRPVEVSSAVASPAPELSVKFGDELEEKNGEEGNDNSVA